ncbi:MAG: hypothetical protein ABWZ87_10585 [Aeromicrobium sp.]
MPSTTTSRRAWCAVIALVLVAGCGGGSDSDEPAATKAPSSAAPTAAPTTAAPDPGPRPQDDRSDAGAIEFSEFVVNRIVGVTTGADIDDVLTLATADCKGCLNLAQQTQKDGTVKQEFESAPVITDAKVTDTSDDGSQYLVEQVLELSPGRKVDTATGTTVETFDESTRLAMKVILTWADDKWVLYNYSSEKVS